MKNKSAETKHRKGLWVCLNGGIFVALLLAISAAITQYLASVFGYAEFLSGRIAGKLFLPWSWAGWAIEGWAIYPG